MGYYRALEVSRLIHRVSLGCHGVADGLLLGIMRSLSAVTLNPLKPKPLLRAVSGVAQGVQRLMDKILHDPEDPKLWELWYIPYNG